MLNSNESTEKGTELPRSWSKVSIFMISLQTQATSPCISNNQLKNWSRSSVKVLGRWCTHRGSSLSFPHTLQHASLSFSCSWVVLYKKPVNRLKTNPLNTFLKNGAFLIDSILEYKIQKTLCHTWFCKWSNTYLKFKILKQQ